MEKRIEDKDEGGCCACDDVVIPEAEWLLRQKRARGPLQVSWLIFVCVILSGMVGVGVLAHFNIWYVIAFPVLGAMMYIGLRRIDKAVLLRYELKCPWCGVPIGPNGAALEGGGGNRLSPEDLNCPRCRQPVILLDNRPSNVMKRPVPKDNLIGLDEWSKKCRHGGMAIGIVFLLWVALSIVLLIGGVWLAEKDALYGILNVPAMLGASAIAMLLIHQASIAYSVICPSCGVRIGPNGYGLGQKQKGYVRLSRSSRRCPRCRTVILCENGHMGGNKG
jgi:hypothetical protein